MPEAAWDRPDVAAEALFAAPAHDIPADAKPENIHATLEVLQNQ